MRLALSVILMLMLAFRCHAAGDLRADTWRPVAQPDLAQRLKAAPELVTEDTLEAPGHVRASTKWHWWVPNPDGKTFDFCTKYSFGYNGPTELFAFDLGTGERTYQFVERDAEKGGGVHNFNGGEMFINGILYKHVYGPGHTIELWTYDPAANAWANHGRPMGDRITGEIHPWRVGQDGMLYGAGQLKDTNQAAAYRIDLKTFKAEVFGPLGPEHKKGVYTDGLMLDGDWIYIVIGRVPYHLVGYNTRTREQKVLYESNILGQGIHTSGLQGGAMFRSARTVDGKKVQEYFWLRQGKVTPRASLDEKIPPWSKETYRSRNFQKQYHLPKGGEVLGRSYDADVEGNVNMWVRDPKAAAIAAKKTFPADTPLEQQGWTQLSIKVKLYPSQIKDVMSIPGDRIFALARGRMIIFDPARGTMEYCGKAGASAYSTLYHDGKIYISGYPSTPVNVFDLAKPSTIGDLDPEEVENDITKPGSNPRMLLRMSKHMRTHYGLALAAGSDGLIYVAGRCYRNGTGGGFGWVNPETAEAGGLWKPFTAYTTFWMCPALGGRRMVISSSPTRDDANPKFRPECGKLFIFDVEQHKIVHEVTPVAKGATGPVVEVAPGLVLGYGGDEKGAAGVLYAVDVDRGMVLWTKPLPVGPAASWGPISHGADGYALAPDGMVWTWMGGTLVRIDPATAEVTPIGTTKRTGRIAFAGGQVYLGSTGSLRRVVVSAK